MATGTIELGIGAAIFPDNSSGNAAPAMQRVQSSAAAPTNGCKLHFLQLAFDGATDEHCGWQLRMPADYASGGTLTLNWKRASGTGAANVVWKGAVAAITPGGTEVPDSKAYNTVATTTTAAGTTATAEQTTDITLTMDSAAAGDSVYIMLGRDADNASDTLNSVDAQVTSVVFTYTTA